MDFSRHAGFSTVFGARPSLGVFFPIESYAGDTPRMRDQEALARRAEAIGFSALWFRDVPLRDPSFGDTGQIFDPWVYLAHIAAHTRRIALVTGAIVLPLRHPLHVAKAAASVDRLSGERLVLGVATGDRPGELAAFGVQGDRGEVFRQRLALIRRAWAEQFPSWQGESGGLEGLDPIPKPALGAVPIMVTGHSRQEIDWIARHADAWVTYPRAPQAQAAVIARWRRALEEAGVEEDRPIAQSLYIDLAAEPRAAPRPIHLGWSLGREPLIDLLETLRGHGMRHVALNLKYGRRPASEVLEEIGGEVIPRLGRGTPGPTVWPRTDRGCRAMKARSAGLST
jgi:luciferase-type oxidoreductase